jgi:hypothetical protein
MDRVMPETKMTSFLNRIKLTNEITNMLLNLLQQYGFKLYDFGYEQILRNEPNMKALMRKLKFKKSPVALMIKFAPDLLCAYPSLSDEKGLFMLDVKASITPVFFSVQIERIKRQAKLRELRREDIGEIEREAWLVYNNFYPKERVCIVMACPYHPRLIIAEWVSNILCMYMLKRDRNPEAGGSGTPHVNIHLGRMRTLYEFLHSEFGVNVNREVYNTILDKIKAWDLNKPARRVNWTQFNNVITELRTTCPWLKHRWPSDGSSKHLNKYFE